MSDDDLKATKRVAEKVRKAGEFFAQEDEIKKLKKQLLQARQNNQTLAEAHLTLRNHSHDMRAVLAFYAADSNYPDVLGNDRGKMARQTLAKIPTHK